MSANPTSPLSEAGLATDTDASLRFAEVNCWRLRFSPGLGWLAWDGTLWVPNADAQAMEASKRSAREWTLESLKSDNRDKARTAISHESGGHIRAAIDLARSDSRMLIGSDKLDSDPWSLNVLNGTIDLRSGTLRPPRREDFITKLAPVRFDPNAKSAYLDRLLAHCDVSTPGMGEFLARCFGCVLTGDAEVETLFLLQGEGGSAKTTLVEAVASILGTYCAKLPFESFCLSKHGRNPGAASPDLMALRGARLAYASEGEQSARLNAGLVKMLTGNEPITARALYREFITFDPTWKLWLVSNYDPKVDSEDTGIWRRLLKLQFQSIPEAQRDPAVKRALTSDPATQSALLAWAVRGCLDWQHRGGGRHGLVPPKSVQLLTDAYRAKQDTLSQWWTDLLDQDATCSTAGVIPVSQIRRHYEDWCRDNGAMPVLEKRFGAYLESKGLERSRGTAGVRRWRGLEMLGETTVVMKGNPERVTRA